MRTVSYLALLLSGSAFAACDATPSAPSCQNPTAIEQACNSCSSSNCGSDISSVIASCPEYVSCYQACDCSDAACIAACAVDVSPGSSCASAGAALALCVQFNCPPSQCGFVSDGGPDATRDTGTASSTCSSYGEALCGGSCVNTMIDPDNCGGCGRGCAPAEICESGSCACVGGTFCGDACVDEQTDSENCGGCGTKCPAGETCQSGACACPSGGSLCGATCVDEQTDATNCGGCGTTCPAAEVCAGGTCACPNGGMLCGATCVQAQSDTNNCGACGVVCGAATPYCAYGACIATPAPNCVPGGAGLTMCGAGSENCCDSPEVTGGTFFRSYDPSFPDAGVITGPDGGPAGEADPASVSSFTLDKYLVTVGRFRQFVNAWNGGAGFTPAAGSGIHSHLNGGKGLVALGVAVPPTDGGILTDGGVPDGGDASADATVIDGGFADGNPEAGAPSSGVAYEPGWSSADDGSIAPTSANLACDPRFATWTPAAGSNEGLPINCVTWQESYAFCIWDGGFLPTEAEWEYATAGGAEQREYPWGSAPPGTNNQYAIYGDGAGTCYYPSGATCTGVANVAPVGTATLGAGLWGQLDLAGELVQWVLDEFAPFVNPSVDGAYLGGATNRALRGGNYGASFLTAYRVNLAPASRHPWVGFRCARAP